MNTVHYSRKMISNRLVIPIAGMILIASSMASTAGPNCHCRTAVGQLIQVGNYSCIKTNEGLREARCEFVLNNTAWKLTGNQCPVTFNQKQEKRINIALINFKNNNKLLL